MMKHRPKINSVIVYASSCQRLAPHLPNSGIIHPSRLKIHITVYTFISFHPACFCHGSTRSPVEPPSWSTVLSTRSAYRSRAAKTSPEWPAAQTTRQSVSSGSGHLCVSEDWIFFFGWIPSKLGLLEVVSAISNPAKSSLSCSVWSKGDGSQKLSKVLCTLE